MSMPAGLAMADRAPDRDGLKLDQLHVPLGPVLPDWPAGLVLHTALQGDVIQDVEVELLDGSLAEDGALVSAGRPFWDEPWLRALAGERVTRGDAARRRSAAHLDSLARLLAVAGWDAATLAARRLRDDLLAGLDQPAAQVRLARLARRLLRSRTLRWLTDRLGVLDPPRAAEAGPGGSAGPAGGDVTARWTAWLQQAAAVLEAVGDDRPLTPDGDLQGPRGPLGRGVWPSQALLELLPGLVVGAELAAARLIVASLDPDPDELVAAGAVDAAHG
jgi:hypothetical protein